MASTHTAPGNAVIGVLVTCMHTATDTIISIERHIAIPRMAARREEGGGITIAISAVATGAIAASAASSAVAAISAVAASNTFEAASVKRPPFLKVGVTIAIIITSAIAIAIAIATRGNDWLLSVTPLLRWLLTQWAYQRRCERITHRLTGCVGRISTCLPPAATATATSASARLALRHWWQTCRLTPANTARQSLATRSASATSSWLLLRRRRLLLLLLH